MRYPVSCKNVCIARTSVPVLPIPILRVSEFHGHIGEDRMVSTDLVGSIVVSTPVISLLVFCGLLVRVADHHGISLRVLYASIIPHEKMRRRSVRITHIPI